MRNWKTGLPLILAGLMTVMSLHAENVVVKAFPTAQGYGRFATGGRGGVVVRVTNLLDYNPATESPIPGSFRWAFTQGRDSTKNRFGVWTYFYKPMTVVFCVGGVIELKTDFSSNRGNVTIAGQTALGEGVCFKGYTLKFGGYDNYIIRFLKSRSGDVSGTETSAARLENGDNYIFDHCTFSWGIEETTHFSSGENFTIQWCLLSESLYNSIHKKGERGYAAQWGGQYSTYHHNLLAHHNSRSPRINGANKNDVYALVDYRNNVNYNWGSAGACYGGEWESTAAGYSHVNFVNNYYKPGPATASSLYFAAPSYNRSGVTPQGYAKWYFTGNVMEGKPTYFADNWLGVNTSAVGGKSNIYAGFEFFVTDGVLEDHAAYTETAEAAYAAVLAGVGATYPKRDAIDARVIGEVAGTIPVTRATYTANDVTTPVKGTSAGIIDTPWNLKPADAGNDWDPWASYYPTVEASQAPIDTDLDGLPDAWEQANGLNPSDGSDYNRLTESGYTVLEVYLNGLVGETIPLVLKQNSVFLVPELRLYPLPATDKLNIVANTPITTYAVYDVSGKRLMAGLFNDKPVVDVAALSEGIYLLSLTTSSNQTLWTKFVK